MDAAHTVSISGLLDDEKFYRMIDQFYKQIDEYHSAKILKKT
jgi:hypothetical protein